MKAQEQIKEWLDGRSQAWLAGKLGVTDAQMSKWLAGKVVPMFHTRCAFASITGLDIQADHKWRQTE